MAPRSRRDSSTMILTLTTIPPRFEYINKFFNILEQQSIRPDHIEVYIAKKYRRFPGVRTPLPVLPSWVEIVETECDFGPATKILPALRRWRGKDVDILYCDDDQIYDQKWLERFASARRAHREDAICECGFDIDRRFGLTRQYERHPRVTRCPRDGKSMLYRLSRGLSFTKYKPRRQRYIASGYIDVAEGFGGVSVRPNFFHERVFEIPDVLWTVDDIWLSGMLEANNVGIWINHNGLTPTFPMSSSSINPLIKHLEDGIDRTTADRMCVEYFKRNYGIWN